MLSEAHDYKWLSLGQMGIRCIIFPGELIVSCYCYCHCGFNLIFRVYRFGVIYRVIASLFTSPVLIGRSHLILTASLPALLYVCCVIQHHMLIYTLRLLFCGVKLFDEGIVHFATMHAQQSA